MAMVSRDLHRRLARILAHTAGVFGLYVHDLHTGRRAEIRAGEAFPAASVIKLPIMLRLLEMVAEGSVRLDDRLTLHRWHKTGGSGIFQYFADGMRVSVDDACTAMIALSDNTTTNLLLDVTGIGPVNAMLDRLGCGRTRLHRYLGKPGMPGPDGPSQAVPAEIGRLLELLVLQRILTPALCRHAIGVLRRQTHRALIPRLLPEGTGVAHKTGSLDGVRHDAGIVWLRARDGAPDVRAEPHDGLPAGRPVVLVAMSRDVQDLRWTVENAAEVAIARAARVVLETLEEVDGPDAADRPP